MVAFASGRTDPGGLTGATDAVPRVNERGHVVNAVLLSVGLAAMLEGGLMVPTATTLLAITVPVTLGALFPDIDTSFGTHRQTFHNIPTLLVFVAFPVYLDNLHYVWIGVATHYVLDLLGNIRGMALFYPWPVEYDVPVGVAVDSYWADVVTLLVTAVELVAVFVVIRYDVHGTVLETIQSLVV